MSTFLDEVFAAQQAPHAPPRRAGEGLSGSGKRFATLLTLMVGLTAVPTFIMVRAGVEQLRSSTAAPVRPILLVVPENVPPSNKQPLAIEPGWSRPLPIVPPEPVVPQRFPILERKAVVDTSVRPVAKKPKKNKNPKVSAQAPAAPTQQSSLDSPKQEPKPRRHKHHHVERPRVERPEKPDVTRPYRESVARPRS